MTLEERLDRIESLLLGALSARPKEWYTVKELAQIIGLSEFQVRQHCNLGRLNGEKCNTGAGSSREWRISHRELERYQQHGLLPRRRFV